MDKDKDIIEIIADEDRGKPLVFKIVCIVCAAVLILSFAVGILLPKSEYTKEQKLAVMREKNKEYLSARSESESLSTEVAALSASLEEKKTKLEEAAQSKEELEKIEQEYDVLVAEEQELKSSAESKQQQLDTLSERAETGRKKTITEHTNGIYAVPDDIPAGTYTVTGTGSIVISNAGKNKVNKMLTSDGETFTLVDGDKVNIQKGKAQFIPE